MLRNLVLGSLVVFTGCVSSTFNKAAYDGVKKAAVVQYALNPSVILGTTNSAEARQKSADANSAQVAAKLAGLGFEIISLEQVKNTDGYKSLGSDSVKGYYLPEGSRVFNTKDTRTAGLTPEEAKALCAALGVDAVITATENWSLQQRAMGFKGVLSSGLIVAMYDKDGVPVFKNYAQQPAEQSFPLAAGVVSGSVDMVRASAEDSVGKSLAVINAALTKAK